MTQTPQLATVLSNETAMGMVQRMWRVYNGHFWTVLLFGLLLSLPFLAFRIVTVTIFGQDVLEADGGFESIDLTVSLFLFLGLVVVSLFYAPLFQLAFFRYLHLPEGEMNMRGAFAGITGSTYGRMLGTSVLFGLIMLAGSILLIIPGVYWGVLYGLATVVVALESAGPGRALARSKELVRGAWWSVFGRNILVSVVVVAVISIVLDLVLGLIMSIFTKSGMASDAAGAFIVGLVTSVVTAPVPLMGLAAIYDWRRQQKSSAPVPV